MKKKIRIILIEDHPEYRDIVELALSSEPDMELIGQFGTSEMAIRSLQDRGRHMTPDVVLLDLNLPGAGGLESIPRIVAVAPEAKIIILTLSSRKQDVLQAIALGASGYLLKSTTVTQLKEGIRNVTAGGASLDSRIAKFVLNTLKTKLEPSVVEKLLTQREIEVLSLLGDGLVKKQIADRLNIGLTTVVTHVSHIYEKLNAPNAPSAITKAFEAGILPLDKSE